jgi:DNA topoisomerase-1
MPKSLLIVESPTKARTIAKYLGRDFSVRASGGHLRDLPKSELGVNLDARYEPKYVQIRGKSKIIQELKADAKKAKTVYLAPDPDREGEAIAWHLAEILKDGAPVRRLDFYEITKKGIAEALERPRDIDFNKVNAQQARRVLDRLVGYKVSPFLWRTLRRGLSAGRVQTVALRLIAEREEEIERFVPQEYWTIETLLERANGEQVIARLVTLDGEKAALATGEATERVAEELRAATYTVAAIRHQEKKRRPLPPYITSTLQQDAFRRLRFSASRTMMLAQQLYEGVELGTEGPVGLITYMRTDSTRISAEAIAEARDHIGAAYGAEYVPDAPRLYRARASAQGAHEAIRPSSVARTPNEVRRYLRDDLFKLYMLIWNRFVSCQMVDERVRVTTADIAAGRAVVRVSGTVTVFDGFTRVAGDPSRDKDTPIPDLREGETLTLREVRPSQHFTEPPPRYTEASLIRALEDKGIGRPSTYATIVSTIQSRAYVERANGSLRPTELGRAVSRLLLATFPAVFDVAFTARMEGELDKVEAGQYDWVQALDDFYKPFSETLTTAEEKTDELRAALQTPSGVICEKCGREMVKKFGRNGPFLACPGYPECRNAKNLDGEAPTPVDGTCPKCGGALVMKTGRYGRFIACSTYPECRHTQAVPIGVACPECGKGQLVEKRSKRGKMFYGCDRYPECSYASWDKPVPMPCPVCEAPFVVEKYSKTSGASLRCPQCKAVVETEAE